MQRELFEFLQGERNAVRGDLIISRECAGNSEYYYVSLPQDEDACRPILKGWAKKIRPPKNAIPIATMEEVPVSKALKKPKHTGGKRSYVMLMQDKESVLHELSIQSAGALMKLLCSGCVEWGTCRIKRKRGKKAMTANEIYKEIGLTAAEGKAVFAELRLKGILTYDNKKKAYFISRDFIKKGGASDAD